MFKRFNVLLCFLVIALLFSGCGGKVTVRQGESSEVTPNGTFPVVKTPRTIKIFAAQTATIEDLTTNEFTKEYEQRTGVKVEWEIAMQNAVQEKRQLSLASGDYPDIYMGANITREEEITYGSKGVFLPLNDLVDTYSVWIKQAFEEIPLARELLTTPDGKIYSLPNMSDAIHTKYPYKLWMNKEWLDELGLDAPETTDDFYNALKAFKEGDPNKNNSKDEIPFFASNNNVSGFINFFINSFIQCNNKGFFVDDNDKLDAAFIKPEWKEGLKYLKKLTDEGLIDEVSYAATNDQVKQIAESPVGEILGSTMMLAPSTVFNMGGERHKKFNPVAPLMGPGGQRNSIYLMESGIMNGCFVVTKQMKDPEVAIRWTDWFYSLEGSLTTRIGLEGVNWRKAEPEEKSYTGDPATWAKMTMIGGAQNITWAQWNIGQYAKHTAQVGDTNIYSPSGLEARLYDATVNYYEPFTPEKSIPPFYIPQEDLKAVLQKINDIGNYVNESSVRFITGDLSLENDWASYVDNLNKMGVSDVLTVYQTAYDARKTH
ncbi:MAG: extracellular solute-binding protein [Firmicutes bacterium]|nr:extracellular solute-binding protein [Bacillota bacterium]